MPFIFFLYSQKIEIFQNGTETTQEAPKTSYPETTLAATNTSSSYTTPSDTAPSPTNVDSTSQSTLSEISASSSIIPQESPASSSTFQTSALSSADTPSNMDSSNTAAASSMPQETFSMDSSSTGVTSSTLESSQGIVDASSTEFDAPTQTLALSVPPTDTVQQSSEFQTPSLSTNAMEALTTLVTFQSSETLTAPLYTGQESTYIVSDWSDSPVQNTNKASDWSASSTQYTNIASDWTVSSVQDSSLAVTIQSSSTDFVFTTSTLSFPQSTASSTELLRIDLSSSVLDPGSLTLSDVTTTEIYVTSVVSDSHSSPVALSGYTSDAQLDSSTGLIYKNVLLM